MDEFDPNELQAVGQQQEAIKQSVEGASAPTDNSGFNPQEFQQFQQEQNTGVSVIPQKQPPAAPPPAPPSPGLPDEYYSANPTAGLSPSEATALTYQTTQQDKQNLQTSITQQQSQLDQKNASSAAALKRAGLPQTSDTLGNQDIADTTRTAIGLSPNFATSKDIFLKKYPQGDFQALKGPDGKEFIVFKRGPEDKDYARLTPDVLQNNLEYDRALQSGDFGKASGVMANIILKSLENNSAEGLTTLALTLADGAGPIAKGIGYGSRLIKGATEAPEAATVGGQAVKQTAKALGRGAANTEGLIETGALTKAGIQQGLAGSGYDTHTDVVTQSEEGAKTGAIAAATTAALKAVLYIGAAAARGVSTLTGAVAGKGLFQVSSDARGAMADLKAIKDQAKAMVQQEAEQNPLMMPPDQAQRTLEAIDNVNFMPHQIIDNQPLLRRLANWVGSTLGRVEEYGQSQQKFLAEQLLKRVNEPDLETAVSRGTQAEKSAVNDINAAGPQKPGFTELPNGSLVQGTTFKKAGDIVNQKLGEYYDNAKKTIVDPAYNAARAIEEPQFNSNIVANAADKEAIGIPKGRVEISPTEDTGIVDANGSPVTNGGTEEVVNRNLERPSPQLRSIIDELRSWRDNPPHETTVTDPESGVTKTVSAMDQINAMKRQLWFMQQPDIFGRTTADQMPAKRLYNALNDMLENTTNQNPEFQAAWKSASAKAREVFDNMDMASTLRGAKQANDAILSTPEGTARGMGTKTGSQVTNWDRIAKIGGEDAINAVRNAHITALLDDPTKLADNIRKMDPELSARLFPDPAEAQRFIQFGEKYKQFMGAGIGDTAKAFQNTNPEFAAQNGVNFVKSLIANKDGTGLQTLEDIIKMAPDSQFGQSIQAGILAKLTTDALTKSKGMGAVNGAALQKGIDELNTSTAARFLSPDQRAFLDKLSHVEQYMAPDSNTGDSLVAANVARETVEFKTKALLSLVENWRLSRWFTNPNLQRFMYGTVDDPTTPIQVWARRLYDILPRPEGKVPEWLRTIAIAAAPGKDTYQSLTDTNKALEQQRARGGPR